jgi:hypothetical protein
MDAPAGQRRSHRMQSGDACPASLNAADALTSAGAFSTGKR